MVDSPESFRISTGGFDSVRNTFKTMLGFIFSNVAGLHLQILLRNNTF